MPPPPHGHVPRHHGPVRPPADPTPEQVVAYAELIALVGDPTLPAARRHLKPVTDEAALIVGVGEAWMMAASAFSVGAPLPAPALDHFVYAHALVRGVRDTPEFRHSLYAELSAEPDPRINRYWDLVSDITGETATLGAAHNRLIAAQADSIRLMHPAQPDRGPSQHP